MLLPEDEFLAKTQDDTSDYTYQLLVTTDHDYQLEPKNHGLDAILTLSHHCEALSGHLPSTDNRPVGLFFTLRVLKRYDVRISQFIVQMATMLRPMEEEKKAELVTVIHEALTNAIFHGNLELESQFDTCENITAFYDRVAKRLTESPYDERCVSIDVMPTENGLDVHITHEGKPYDASTVPVFEADKMHGRGLAIIQAFSDNVTWSHDGYTLITHFHIAPASATHPTASVRLAETMMEPSFEEQRQKLKQSLLLLVDDTDYHLTILSELLSSHGFERIITAENGQEALDKTLTHKPDMVILDIMMPVMNGLDYCQHIRAIPEFQQLPVLFQTSRPSAELRTKAFDAGATDLVTKPLNQSELIARVFVHLEKQALLKDLAIYKELMDKELEIASTMQKSLMPGKRDLDYWEKQHKLHVEAHFEPSSIIGGDIWGLRKLSSHETAIYMIDFSGHGVISAINTFRLHSIMQEDHPEAKRPDAYLSLLNRYLEALLSTGQFATMFYGVINSQENHLYYAAAGSPAPVILRRAHYAIDVLDGTGYPLGCYPDADFPLRQTTLDPMDMLLLYSDALTETPDAQGQLLSDVQFIDHLRDNQAHFHTAGDLMAYVLALFRRYQGNRPAPLDDLTITIYKRLA